MRVRSLTPGVLALLLIGAMTGCEGGAAESTTSSSGSGTSTTTTAASTSTSTSISTTTTTAPTTSATSPADQDRYLPAVMGRSEIPWDEIGPGWYLVLYDSSKADPVSEDDVRDGTEMLLLVSGSGDRYEVTSWEGGGYSTLVDGTHTTALIARVGSNPDETVYELVDLESGSMSVVYTVGFPERSYVNAWPHAALTRPTGANTVVYRGDGAAEWLERRSSDGTVLSVVFEQPATESPNGLSWLYTPDGTSLVVGHRDGLTLASNDGSRLTEIWIPQDNYCDPVRWWDRDTLLSSCFGQGPGSAPLDDQGQAHTYYGRLWLLEVDGSAGVALTEYPAEPPIVVDFGYHDAWPTGEVAYMQWYGDCGSAHVATLNPDGTGEFMDIAMPPEFSAHGVKLVDIVDGRMTLYGWLGCDASIGQLFTVDLTGRYIETLVPVIEDARGVVGVVGLDTVYP